MNENIIEILQHPDELFDRPYEKKYIDINQYDNNEIKDVFFNEKNKSVKVSNKNGSCTTFEICSNNIVHIQACPNSKYVVPTNLQLNIRKLKKNSIDYNENENFIYIKNHELEVQINKKDSNFSISGLNSRKVLETVGGGIRLSNILPDFKGYRSFCEFSIDDEYYYGFGGRTANPNRTGCSIDLFNIKAGVVSGDYGGCTVPFFMSTKGYGIFFNNFWPHVYFDMGKTYKDKWFFNTPGGNCDMYIIVGNNFKDIIYQYTYMTGRIPIPPKWYLGFWVSSLTIKNSDEVINIAKRFRKERIPCDVILLDAQWRVGPQFLDQYTTGIEYPSNDIDWNEDFGDKDLLIKELKKLDYKIGLHLNSRNFSTNTKNFGIKNNYIIEHNSESFVNFLNAKAKDFYENLIKMRLSEGIDVWWIDHSDRVSGVLPNGIPIRNILGVLWCKLVYEIMIKFNKEGALSLTRGNGIGGQKYGFPWPGDTANGIEHFKEDIWYCINAGLAGYPLSSVDLGGFNLKHLKYGLKYCEKYKNEEDIHKEVFDDENILRRLCQGLICIPVPRIHNNWCTPPKFPWNCSDRVKRIYKKYILERYKLTPYYYSAVVHSSKTGEPILRPLVYEYSEDKKVFSIDDEFLLGECLLVAPITEKGVTNRDVYLPSGKWFYIWDDHTIYENGMINIKAPLYSIKGLPIFVKENSIIARQRVTKSISNEPPKLLLLDFYVVSKSVLYLYETPSIKHKFTCVLKNKCVKITLENKLSYVRRYILKLHNINFFNIKSCDSCTQIKIMRNNWVMITLNENSKTVVIFETMLKKDI